MKRRDFLRSSLQLLVASHLLPSITRASSLARPTTGCSYGIIGDCGWSAEETAPLRASLKRAGISKLILPGDNLYDVSNLSFNDVWDVWKQDGFEFSVTAIGNHTAGYEAERAYFGMPAEYYAYQEGPCLFLVLNSDNEKTVTEQRDWLIHQLSRATAPCIFVVFHHPPASITNHHGWTDKINFQNAIRPVLMANATKINALFVGHDHIAGLYDFGGIPLVVSGAGVQAQEARSVQNQVSGVSLQTKWVYQEAPMWVRLDVDAAGTNVDLSFIDVATADLHQEKILSSIDAWTEADAS